MRKLIKNNQFKEAVDLIDFNDFKITFNNIYKLAYDEEDEIYYRFLKYIIENVDGSAKMHYYASELMSSALNILPSGYETAFEHAKIAINIDPNDISLKEYILLFNEIPEKLLNDNEARKIAEEILTIDVANKAALRVLGN